MSRTAWAVLALSAFLASSAHAQGTAAQPLDAEVDTAPVTLDGIVLFRVRGASSYPADTRARLIGERLAAAAADRSIAIDALRAVPIDHAVRIDAGDRPIMAVADADGALERLSRAELAAAHLFQLRAAITEYREARTPRALWRSGVRSVIATVLLVMTIVVLIWMWRWFDRLMRQRVQARIHSVGIQSFEVMRAEQIRAGLQSMVLGARIFLFVALALVYVGYVLAQWPSTRALSHGTVGLVLDPLRTVSAGFVANIPRVAFLAVLFVITRVVLRLTRLFFDAIGRGAVQFAGFEREWADPTYKILRIIIVAFALIVAYPYIPGSQSEAFKGVSLFIGIVFSLGSSSAISNIIAGYMMTYRRAFRVGDRVKIGESVGEVIEMRLQVTHLRSLKNEEIVIPNSQILSGEVLNYSSLAKTHGLLLHTEVGIGYETSWRHVETILLDAAARTPGLGAEPKPFVLVKRLGDFAVTYELNAACGDVNAIPAAYTALHHNVLDVFNEYGVQIMTPAYEGDPAEPKVVPLKELYAPAPRTGAPRPETVAPGR